MKKKLLFLFLASVFVTGMQAQTLLYANDFEDGLGGATIVGNGVLTASGDASHGQVFHNAAGGQATRTNYLLLPNDIFANLQASGQAGVTISFWVNKGTATGFYWSPIFSAYGAAPAPENTWPMMVLQTRLVGQVNNAGWSDLANAQNVKGTNTESTAWIDNTSWHFYTATFTPTSVKVYVDGVVQNEWVIDGVSEGQVVSGLFTNGNALTYICLGGNQAWNWNDPDPAFMYDKLKIYAGALTSAQVNSLMTTDQLSAPVLTVNKSAIYLDDLYAQTKMVVNGANLAQDITITAPAGITVNPTSIAKESAADVNVTVSFDGTIIINGEITITSGSMSRTVTVVTSTNEGYQPAYESGNMIADPTFSAESLAAGGFTGWGPTGIINKNAYSGRGSAYIRGSCWPDGGSIDRPLTAANGNELKPNTQYRLRAMVNSQASPGTFFQFEIEGYDGAASKFFLIGNTNGWKQIDTMLVTGATVVTGKGIYFNSCGANTPLITDTAFIDNYELYEVPLGTGLVNNQASVQKVYTSGKNIIAEFSLGNQSEVTLTVFDMQGKTMSQTTKRFEGGSFRQEIDVQLPNGMYVVQLSSGEFVNKHKLIVR